MSLLPRLLPPALESPLLLLPVQPLAQLAGSGPSGEHAPPDARGGGGANLTSPCETARSEPARRPRLPLRSRLRTAVGPVGGAGRGGAAQGPGAPARDHSQPHPRGWAEPRSASFLVPEPSGGRN